MKFDRDYFNPKTGRTELVRAVRINGVYVLHDLSLPSKVRKLKAHQILIASDAEMERRILSGRYGARCTRVGVKGSKPSEFTRLEVRP